jgi:hypothetical protein
MSRLAGPTGANSVVVKIGFITELFSDSPRTPRGPAAFRQSIDQPLFRRTCLSLPITARLASGHTSQNCPADSKVSEVSQFPSKPWTGAVRLDAYMPQEKPQSNGTETGNARIRPYLRHSEAGWDYRTRRRASREDLSPTTARPLVTSEHIMTFVRSKIPWNLNSPSAAMLLSRY